MFIWAAASVRSLSAPMNCFGTVGSPVLRLSVPSSGQVFEADFGPIGEQLEGPRLPGKSRPDPSANDFPNSRNEAADMIPQNMMITCQICRRRISGYCPCCCLVVAVALSAPCQVVCGRSLLVLFPRRHGCHLGILCVDSTKQCVFSL